MANTYSSLLYHIVFSTKHRTEWIRQEIESRIWSYVGGIARKHDCKALQVGGFDDHLHSLIMAPPTLAVCKITQFLKGDSSKWIHDEFPELKGFGWQDGYSAFSVSLSGVPKVIDYIRNQRVHHSTRSFEDEYRELLRLHEIDPISENYIFG